jgi:hypothetical protein
MHRTCATVLGTAVLAIAGCGDSKDSSSSSSKSLTKAQFIAKADGICKDTKKAQQPYSNQIDKLHQGDLKKAAPILEGALGVSKSGLARLKALPSPSEDKATLDQYYAAADKVIAAHSDLTDAAKTDDAEKGKKVAATTDGLSADEGRLADKYGIKECDNVF